MKIIFKEVINKDILIINVNQKGTDQYIKENNINRLFLKSDEKMHLRKLFILIRKMIILSKKVKTEKICFDFNSFVFKEIKISKEELAEILGVQISLANYEFTKYKSKKKETFIKEIYIKNCPKDLEKTLNKGITIGEEINKSRTLSNTPGGDMTPSILTENVKESAKGLPIKISILGESQMKKLKMEAILSVGRGSDEESKFIILEYYGAKNKKEKPIVLIGKGVTFDSGGINLKPSSGLTGMNMDMSGGAIVIHAISLIAKMKLKKNVIALIPSVENFISGKSYRPGDVIYSMSGKTIEILNTDAEGRVILADALTYAEKYNPKVVIDVATLTGASMIALGERISALFTDDDKLSLNLEKIGNITGDYLWRLPMWEEYEAEIKGSLGDFTNISNKNSPYGGAINGAIFLKQFSDKYNWVHIDMAPRMVSIDGDYLAKGATGSPLYLLYKFVESEQNG